MLNSTSIIGKWAKDVELRVTQGGKPVISVDLMVVDGYGEKARFYYIPVVIWDKQAENVANHCSQKGRLVCVNGKMTSRTYETQDGQKRKVVELVAYNVDFLDRGETQNEQRTTMGKELPDGFDDDCPVPF